jgi:hypothetical protein
MKWLSWFFGPHQGASLWAFMVGGLAVGVLLLALLTSVPPRYRKAIVMAITFLAGLYYSLEFLLPPEAFFFTKPRVNPLSEARPFVGTATQIVWSFALLLGIWNLFQIHGKAVVKRGQGWYNSAAFFIAFSAIVMAGFLKDAGGRVPEQLYGILFRGFLTSLDATMFSLIAFYIVSAAYRAFRVRSTEAALMMAAAAIIMLALVPVGVVVTNWLPETGFFSIFRLERIGYWLLIWPNMAAQRAIAFGVAVGGLAMGLRIWLSLERGSFFDRQL